VRPSTSWRSVPCASSAGWEPLGDLPVSPLPNGPAALDIQRHQRHPAVERGIGMADLPAVATAMLDASPILPWQKSGSTTGGAARPIVRAFPRRSSMRSSAGGLAVEHGELASRHHVSR
jgi:hypothetical protein